MTESIKFNVLSPEGMQKAIIDNPDVPMGQAIAKEALKDALRQVVKWGNSDCPHVSHSRGKHWCGECWQQVIDEMMSV